jgi:uncharacterized NAD-dependent epimerase/dehydratase family protein
MWNLSPYRRLAILAEGALGVFTAKTASSVIRYRPDDVVAIVDSARAGAAIEAILGVGEGIPIVPDVASATPYKPDALLIGVAPAGGQLPPAMRDQVIAAVTRGLAIISGLHMRLRDDPDIAERAAETGASIFDVRDPGVRTHLALGRARQARVRRVLTVGTDCSVGKMVAALELRNAARHEGLDAAFVATGQTGIMIEGWGTAIDAVVSDFAAGAAEQLIEPVADRDICFIEGQGSIAHPAYSPVALALIHGTCPDAMIMCHRPGRMHYHDEPACPITPIEEQIRLCEAIAHPLHPSRVAGIAVNSAGMEEAETHRHIDDLRRRTGLPVCDPIRTGVGPLLRPIREACGI